MAGNGAYLPATPGDSKTLSVEVLPSTAIGGAPRSYAGIGDVSLLIEQHERRLAQLEQPKEEKPWYKSAAVLISLAAFIFSLATTAVSWYRAAQQDVHDSRTELRSFVQRLSTIPKDIAETEAKSDDPVKAARIGAFLGAEAAVITAQALDVMRRIPSHVTLIEYIAVATSLAQQGNFTEADRVVNLALAAKRDPDDLFTNVALRRMAGMIAFARKRIDVGRKQFAEAVEIGSTLAADEVSARLTEVRTRVNWATAEMSQRNFTESSAQLEQARKAAEALPAGPPAGISIQEVVDSQRNLARATFAAKPDEGRANFKKAIVSTSAANIDRSFAIGQNLTTHLTWAEAEMSAGAYPEARTQIEETDKCIQLIPPGSIQDNAKRRLLPVWLEYNRRANDSLTLKSFPPLAPPGFPQQPMQPLPEH
jgi:hypothetical protein